MKALFTGYAWITGALFFLFFLSTAYLLSWIMPLRKCDPFLKLLLRLFFVPLRIKVTTHGTDQFDPGKPHIYMLNHVSFLDIPLVGGFIPGFVRGIEASRQHKWPLYGRVMGRLGNIPIERENIHASLSVTQKAKDSLESGTSMIIFPEGGRTGNGLMKRFKKLPFHLAKQSGFDLIPVGISGMFEVNNKNAWYMGPGHVHLTFGTPIPAEKIAEMETLELRKQVFERIQHLAGQAE